MKILHLPFTYMPDPHGGTEVYVAALCRYLEELGVHSEVAAPAGENASYEHEGVRVHRFAAHPALSQEMMFGGGDPVAAEGFAEVLDRVKPNLVHFHSFTPAVSVRCLQEVKRRGLRSVVTYHTPTTSCVRGTLMRWGSEVCDGEMRTLRCAACFLNSRGMPRMAAWSAAVGSLATWPLSRLPGQSNAVRAVLGAGRLMKGRLDATREWWAGMDRVIALCEWTRELLLRNGVAADRIRKVRHGLPTQGERIDTVKSLPQRPLRLAFLGRLDPAKGIDLLIDALRMAPELPIELDLFALAQTGSDPIIAKLLEEVRRDSRVRLCEPVSSSEVVNTLRNYHALLVPSRWLETGPLVVLEAFAAGIPVVGSRLGGIAEWVTHQENGLLVDAPTATAWCDVIKRLTTESELIAELTRGVRAPRSMSEVASETLAIYAELLK